MNVRTLILACLAVPAAASAQSDPMQMARVASANQAGVMAYCQSKGWADQEAVDAQKAGMANLPPAPANSETTAAEATGTRGSLLNNGTAMPLAAMAQQTHTTEQALCGQFASSAKMMAAQRSAMPSMPGGFPSGMPAMPSGTTMPGFPKTR